MPASGQPALLALVVVEESKDETAHQARWRQGLCESPWVARLCALARAAGGQVVHQPIGKSHLHM